MALRPLHQQRKGFVVVDTVGDYNTLCNSQIRHFMLHDTLNVFAMNTAPSEFEQILFTTTEIQQAITDKTQITSSEVLAFPINKLVKTSQVLFPVVIVARRHRSRTYPYLPLFAFGTQQSCYRIYDTNLTVAAVVSGNGYRQFSLTWYTAGVYTFDPSYKQRGFGQTVTGKPRCRVKSVINMALCKLLEHCCD